MTSGSTGSSSTWSSLKASNWLAVMTMASATSRLTLSMREGRMPTSTAIALAVSGWSPVSMCTEMPASWHFPTACADSGRGGSYSPIRPESEVVLDLGALRVAVAHFHVDLAGSKGQHTQPQAREDLHVSQDLRPKLLR